MLSAGSSRRVEITKKEHLQKESLVSRNGAILLEEVIKSAGCKYNPYRIFSKKELEIATNYYDNDRILKEDGYYALYMGIHEERKISVKKFHEDHKYIIFSEIIDDFVISLQIRNHKNVMEVLGCCLETKIPILVYEYPVNKNFSNLLHEKSVTKENRPPILSFESKLRIATEIADAVTYMHIATSTPIIHRDIKSCNIFLGEQNVVKLFGFDLSLKIPSGEEDVETNMSRTIGTIGYIAPECMSGQPITEKCDVYGFGSTLIEILTEMTPWAFKRWLRLEDSSNVVSDAGGSDLYFSKEQVFEVSLKRNILGEGEIKQVMACITLAWECRKDNPTERPSIKEVTEELRRIKTITG
ncbi:hypothetical protein GIB67_033741 [Kingdonia uniflora]|uniref:Protein kinase domain-containing protein n=1 Tax=Kingdonia uniflora TaxID=39325 RepID=A0A7J7P435_9MAGN|nr:hypothetical protein GIB67_033741 [Kingdonia uniflora]